MTLNRPKVVILSALLLCIGAGVSYWCTAEMKGLPTATGPIDPERAYDYLRQICEIGPRMSGSPGMIKQREMLAVHFREHGAKLLSQEFSVRHPEDGSEVKLVNLIAQWNPEKKERILLCCHYDTRPYPDNDPDPRKRKDVFIGANDGGSGVAALCELAHHIKDLKIPYGIDVVFF